MKKKLKIYSALLAIVLIGTILFETVEVSGSSSTKEDGEELYFGALPEDFATTDSIEGGIVKNFKPTFNIEVAVRPRNFPKDFALLSEVDGQVCRVDMQQVQLVIPRDRVIHSSPFLTGIVMLVPILLLFVWLFVIVFQVLRSVARKEVFAARIAKKLELAGILLVIIQLLNYAGSYIMTQTLVRSVNMAYYDIVWLPQRTTCLIMGLTLMIVSQVILMGKDLKEEQELTI